jgi:hypothetical protein
MFGKPAWFQRRKYAGWGIYPKTWQGWVYMVVLLAPLFLMQALPISGDFQVAAMVIWAILAAVDMVHIMIQMPKDERDRMHEAIAERNALWTIIAALAAGIGFQAAIGVIQHRMGVDPVILIALFAGLAAKAITNIYLDKHD